jgi:hypothetical protein
VSRHLIATFLGIMLVTVVGQAVRLREYERRPVSQIDLHESRLVPFLLEIRRESPLTYDSTLLNLSRIRDADREHQHQPEERVVAQTLIDRLTAAD